MVLERTPQEVAAARSRGDQPLILLDVREPDEVRVARIDRSIHIPMGEIVERIAEIPRDREVVVYCHHGNRSMAVAAYLESEGYERVTNLEGGIDAWSQSVDPRVPRY